MIPGRIGYSTRQILELQRYSIARSWLSGTGTARTTTPTAPSSSSGSGSGYSNLVPVRGDQGEGPLVHHRPAVAEGLYLG